MDEALERRSQNEVALLETGGVGSLGNDEVLNYDVLFEGFGVLHYLLELWKLFDVEQLQN